MPDWKPEIRRRLATLSLAPTREAAIIEELAQHLDDCYAELLSGGVTEGDAYRAALAELSGSELLTRELRRVERQFPQEPIVLGTNRRTKMIADLLQDVRYGARMLLKQKGFTLVALLMLALGIGATTAVFSLVDAWLLRPLPFREPERLVAIWHSERSNPAIPSVFASYRDYEEWQRQNQSFEQMAGFFWRDLTLTGQGETASLMGQVVTANYFATLGIAPLQGRVFQPSDASGSPVAVLGYGFWQRQFNGAADVVGKAITLNDRPFTIIGVAPPIPSLPSVAQPDRAEDVWVLVRPDEPMPFDKSYRAAPGNPIGIVARLKPGISVEQARAELTAIKTQTDARFPTVYQSFTPFIANLQQDATRSLRPTLLMIAGAAGFVLLIVCANVAGLLLARLAERRRELAIRNALGAGRGRIVRQTLTESGLLALLGGVLGVPLAWWLLRLLLALNPFEIPAFNEIAINYRALLFSTLLVVCTALLFGAIPALQASRLNVNEWLKESSRSGAAGARQQRAQRLLVVAEVALSLMLLAGAGLLMRSLARLQTEPLGYRTDKLVTLRVTLPTQTYPQAQQRGSFFTRLLERAQALPGLQTASATTLLPVSSASNEFAIEGRPPAARDAVPRAGGVTITANYFSTLGTPLRSGRLFNTDDRENATPVAIINETLAQKFFPGADPIGKRIKLGKADDKAPWRVIVGVVGNHKTTAYGNVGFVANAFLYVPLQQNLADAPPSQLHLIVHPASDATALTAAIRAEIKTLDPNLPAPFVQTMDELIARPHRQPRIRAMLSSSLALTALLLAALGLYGVISYAVMQRTHEIGIRMALGAQGRDVLRMMLRQGMMLTLTGALLGIGGALAMTRLLQASLYGVSATDPLTYLGITLLLTFVAWLACWLPAQRATKVDPLTALRHD